jgi:prepilin signal peptidase PulO-like enzyme (type II secretory pathway)
LLVLALVDACTMVIPTTVVQITGALTAAALITSNFIGHQLSHLLAGLICALVTFLSTATWAVILPRTLGFGDVRFSTMVAFGAGMLEAALCLAVISAALLATGVLSKLGSKRGRAPRPVPLGPFLALAGLACMVSYGAA